MTGAVDRNVEAVRDRLLQRSQAGLAKYGVTTERGDLSQSAWLLHLQEELLDAAVYVERIRALLAIAETQGWQPIETCPRDGTWVWAYWNAPTPHPEFAHKATCVTAYIDFEWRDPDDHENVYGEPTHWQPLPPPPKESDERTPRTVD